MDTQEWQRYDNSLSSGSASTLNDYLNTMKINGTFVWDHTYAASVGYFRMNGSADADMSGASGLANNPNSDGLVFDLSYSPFSPGSPGLYSTFNARLGIQHTTYLRLNGGTGNFDGLIGTPGAGGRFNVSSNNTWRPYAALAF